MPVTQRKLYVSIVLSFLIQNSNTTVTTIILSFCLAELKGSAKEPNISTYFFFFPPITQWFSISDVLFTGGRGVSDFSVYNIIS